MPTCATVSQHFIVAEMHLWKKFGDLLDNLTKLHTFMISCLTKSKTNQIKQKQRISRCNDELDNMAT